MIFGGNWRDTCVSMKGNIPEEFISGLGTSPLPVGIMDLELLDSAFPPQGSDDSGAGLHIGLNRTEGIRIPLPVTAAKVRRVSIRRYP